MELEIVKAPPAIQHDGLLTIATAQTMTAKKWKNVSVQWSELVEHFEHVVRTGETVAEFKKMTTAEQSQRKDQGAFVGGGLKQGRRKIGYVQNRSLLTLDADNAPADFPDQVSLLLDCAYALYTTHSHKIKGSRYRLVIPLAKAVETEAYQPLARLVANDLNIEYFDTTTYQAERLMHYPSTSSDGVYELYVNDGPWLNAQEWLGKLDDWTDSSYWPTAKSEREVFNRRIKKAEDPLTKRGVIGAFCRTYSMTEALDKFLSEVYAPTNKSDRYTYIEGSTSGGLVVYDDKFAYSNHGTDPAGTGHIYNAFDLVRIHLFGDKDADITDPNKPVDKLPSYQAMQDMVQEDVAVLKTLQVEREQSALSEFEGLELEEVDEDGESVLTNSVLLDVDKRGNVLPTAQNLEKIMRYDRYLKGRLKFNQFASRIEIHDNLPWRKVKEVDFWRDSDDAGLRVYIEKVHGIVAKGKIEDAFAMEVERNAYDPLMDYVNGLSWDGVERAEKLLITYLGAQDTEYNRLVTRKWLTGMIARALRPGVKFDNMLVTTGPQGIGKSTLGAKLAGKWYSDSLDDLNSKDAYESLQGTWLVEMGEMAATKKSDIERVKGFISKKEDVYRAAYGRRKQYCPRRCVFYGTSNEVEFLHDKTGNRRFWPVDVGVIEIETPVWDLDTETRDQILAEAKHWYDAGEKIYLTDTEEALAREAQDLHMEQSSLEGEILEYLDTLITEDWYTRTKEDRREFIRSGGDLEASGTELRQRVCVAEVAYELYGTDASKLHPAKRAEIRNILNNISGWSRHGLGRGRLRFGPGYGLQTAYTRNVDL
ncbi:virulence-associated E family protein [Enterococcus cecorum]|uniref:virulence-associated E family protein n=1 Tax=Enterococcus cecorum TaxID=44008 RepID=UPI003265319D